MMSHLFRRGFILLALILEFAGPARAQSPVYVLEEGAPPVMCSGHPCYGPTIHLFNAVTGHDFFSVLAAPLGRRGTSLTISSDGSRLFVTHTPYFGPSGPGQLSVVDAVSRVVLGQVTVGAGAADVAILPDNSRAYVANTADGTVSVVDLSSLTVVATVHVQSGPARIVAAPDGGAVYVTNSGSGTVSRISTAGNSIAATIPVGSAPFGIDISPDGSRIFVANADSQTVSVIDASLDSVLHAIPAGSAPAQPRDVAAQSATRVYVVLDDSAGSTSAVALLDAADGGVIGLASILRDGRLARDASGTPAYVVDSFGSTSALKRLAADGSSATTAAPGYWEDAAVFADPCAFEATATATAFGPSGGTGTLAIPAPSGCAWTIDPSGFGLSVASPLSGTGPATRTYTVPSATAPKIGDVRVGWQEIRFEQTIPRMNVEVASSAAARQEPFAIGGWAFDENAVPPTTEFADTGVDAVHVWAYPVGGEAPIFAGAADYGMTRGDIAAIYGEKYLKTGFSISINNLRSGAYTLVFYAHSRRSNSFSNAQAVAVSVQQTPPYVLIDAPTGGTVRTPFTVAGWATDSFGTTSGTGVDVIHVWVYPAGGGAPQFVGQPIYGIARPDVAAAFGASLLKSGYSLTAVLAPGKYTLAVFARSVATGRFNVNTVSITVAASNPQMAVDMPRDGGTPIAGPFHVAGWALDLAAGTGSGVDAVHVWAYPVGGGAPVWVGDAFLGLMRPDVSSAYGAQFANPGFALTNATLPAGTYDLAVFARSTVTLTFNNVRVVRITVQ
jgi:YVTN family beta-propeller protein